MLDTIALGTSDVEPPPTHGRRSGTPVSEVGFHGPVEVAADAGDGVPVADLEELRARLPLASGPRVGLPCVGDEALVEEVSEWADSAVGADRDTGGLEDRAGASEVAADVEAGRVEVDREIHRPDPRPRGEAVAELRERGAGVLDAGGVALERAVPGALPHGHDVNPCLQQPPRLTG